MLSRNKLRHILYVDIMHCKQSRYLLSAVGVYPDLRPPDLIRTARNNTQGGNEPNAKERSSIWMHFTQKSNYYPQSDVCKVEISLKTGSTNNLKSLQSAKVLHVVCMHVLGFAVN